MHAQELSIELPSQGTRRATGEGSTNGWQKPQRLSARHQTAAVLRLWCGEPLDLVSRALGIPAARLTTWREACLAAGQGRVENTLAGEPRPRAGPIRSTTGRSHDGHGVGARTDRTARHAPPLTGQEVETMRPAPASSPDKPSGLARVCRVWGYRPLHRLLAAARACAT